MSIDLPPRQRTPRAVSPEQAGQLLVELEQAAQIGAYIWTPDDAPIWSDGFYRILGFQPRDPALIAANFYERVHPDDLSHVVAEWEKATRGEMVTLTYRIIRCDGVTRWIEGRCLPTVAASGHVARILGTVEDITPEHEARTRLAHAHAVLRDTQRAAGVGSHLYHVLTGQLEWSEELFRILGIDPATPVTPQLAAAVAHPDDAEKQLAWGQRVARGEVMPPLLARVIRSDGAVRYLETRASWVELPTGPTVQGVSIDVTARVEMEEQLRHAAKMEAIGTLAAGIAHDFNNYLGVLTMNLDSIADDANDELAASVRGARHATEQCSAFTRQLLTFAREQPSAPRELDLNALVRDTAGLIQRLLGASIAVALELAGDPLMTHADPGQLESALVNLAANARDAMPLGGQLRMQLSSVELTRSDPRLEGACLPGRYALICVSDTGTGIAEEHIPRVFEPYFSTKPAGQGTGLGLAAVYGAVRQHQGFVRVKSTLGRGTAFEVYLPQVERTLRTTGDGTRPPVATQGKLIGRVLVVEDMDALRDLAVRMVQSTGLEVVAAADGVKALAIAQAAQTPFDVVVTDLMMPGMTGGELALAMAERWPSMGFVFMTGYAAQDVHDALLARHPHCKILRKPFRSHALIEAVRELFAPNLTISQ